MKQGVFGFILGILFVCCLFGFKQSSATKVEYCELLGIQSGILSNRVKISVDFGQRKREKIKDSEENVIKFNSMIDAFNYMSGDGWKIEQTYAITHGNQHVYHFLMSREYSD